MRTPLVTPNNNHNHNVVNLSYPPRFTGNSVYYLKGPFQINWFSTRDEEIGLLIFQVRDIPIGTVLTRNTDR